MRSYAPAMETLQWQTLTPQHMPPIGEDFLLWRAINESDGGICTLADAGSGKAETRPLCTWWARGRIGSGCCRKTNIRTAAGRPLRRRNA